MKARAMVATIGLLSCLLAQVSASQTATEPEEVQFSKKSLSGPRLGFTVVLGNSELARRLKDEGISPIISQFGWRFEHRVIANGNGPAFVSAGSAVHWSTVQH